MQKAPLDIHVIEQEVTHIFPRSFWPSVKRVEEGVSTYVYKIHWANEIFYLRILPEIGASFAPEAYVHRLLQNKQVKVPEVIYFEHYNEALQCSIMVTTEIKGQSLSYCSVEHDWRTILFEAGRDLAIINGIPVKHFGWIRRDSGEIALLEAEFSSYRAFIYEHIESDLVALQDQVLKARDISAIRQLLDRFDPWLDSESAWLAHGDFDVTHIYQYQGRYTGIIDFGEIRGAHPLYDLGHFRMHDGERLSCLVLPYLLEGYKEAAPLPSDYEYKICFFSLLIAIRTLARMVKKRPKNVTDHYALKSIPRDIQVLLA